MVDASDLGSGVLDVGVQVPSSALKVLHFQSVIVNSPLNPTTISIILSIKGASLFHGRNCNNGRITC